MDKGANQADGNCIAAAFHELKRLQDYITNVEFPLYGNFLIKLVGLDTIPFYLYNKEGRLTLMGTDTRKDGKKDCFETSFFRMEEIDQESSCVTVSLLRPLNIHDKDTNHHCDVFTLRKTSECVVIDLNCICAIQLLEPELLKRKIIIEPKW